MRPLTDRLRSRAAGTRQTVDRISPERLAQAGVERIVINLAWLGNMIREALGERSRFRSPDRYSDEAPAGVGDGRRSVSGSAAARDGAFLS